MQENKKGEFRSRVYTDRPSYADLPSPAKFQAIMGIIMTRLTQHPNAICSISGGSDSDILLDLIERSRQMVSHPEVKYCFFNTGLEMAATKRHIAMGGVAAPIPTATKTMTATLSVSTSRIPM